MARRSPRIAIPTSTRAICDRAVIRVPVLLMSMMSRTPRISPRNVRPRGRPLGLPLRNGSQRPWLLAPATYLVLVCLLPEFLITGFKIQPIPWIGPPVDNFLNQYDLEFITTGLGVTFYFGGTSLLIVVGVAMDTVNQVESQLIMRHYEGFLKKGRIRGRRG